MKYLLDSNAVIAMLKGHAVFLVRLRQYRPDDFVISSIVRYELFYGAYKSRRTVENIATVEALQFEVLEFSSEDARHAGQIRALLTTSGTPIGPYDVLIAGQAISRGLTLLTHNTREFSRVAGLTFEDWET